MSFSLFFLKISLELFNNRAVNKLKTKFTFSRNEWASLCESYIHKVTKLIIDNVNLFSLCFYWGIVFNNNGEEKKGFSF